jgi:phage regulator Rha-like protein
MPILEVWRVVMMPPLPLILILRGDILMNELVVVKGNELFTDSMVISEGACIEHESVMRMIDKYNSRLSRLGKIRFTDLKSGNSQGGRPTRIAELNEPQSTFLLTLLKNTEPVVDFKFKLTQEFFRMRQFIIERQSSEWQQARLTGKQVRKDETDIILTKLIPLAEFQGSQNAGKLYMTYSKLVNSTLGIEAGKRDNLPLSYIDAIKFLERAIENIISIEVDKGTHYKEIYQVCKVKCQIIKDLAFLPSLKMIG